MTFTRICCCNSIKQALASFNIIKLIRDMLMNKIMMTVIIVISIEILPKNRTHVKEGLGIHLWEGKNEITSLEKRKKTPLSLISS